MARDDMSVPAAFAEVMEQFSISEDKDILALYVDFCRVDGKEAVQNTHALFKEIRNATSKVLEAIKQGQHFRVNPVVYVACRSLYFQMYIDDKHMSELDRLYIDFLSRFDAKSFLENLDIERDHLKKHIKSNDDALDALESWDPPLDVAALCWVHRLAKTSDDEDKRILCAALASLIPTLLEQEDEQMSSP